MIDWYKQFYSFDNRAKRKEFIILFFVQMALSMVVAIFETMVIARLFGGYVAAASGLVIGIVLFLWPFTATMARRLHDMNLSGWWMLPAFAVMVVPGFLSGVERGKALVKGATVAAMDPSTMGSDWGILIWAAFLLFLMVFPGTAGKNKYGDDSHEYL